MQTITSSLRVAAPAAAPARRAERVVARATKKASKASSDSIWRVHPTPPPRARVHAITRVCTRSRALSHRSE